MTLLKTKPGKWGVILVSAGGTALLCVILLWIFGAGSYLNASREFESEQTPPRNAVSDESISIPGFETMTIPAGQISVPAYLYNPKGNLCYFEISIILAETDEEIYKSKLVSPGQELYRIELARTLEKGAYDAILRYDTFSISDYADMNGADVPFTLIAE